MSTLHGLRRLYEAVRPVIDHLRASSHTPSKCVPGVALPVEALEARQLLTAIVVNGTSGNDTYLLRNHPDTVNYPRTIQLFANATGTGTPLYQMPISQADSIQVNGNAGDDKLIVDVSIAAPFPNGLLTFNGNGQGTAGDMLEVRGCNWGKGSYRPGTDGSATFIAWRKTMNLAGLEAVTASDFRTTELLTPAGSDQIVLDTPASGQGRVRDDHPTPAFAPLTFSNTSSLIVNVAYSDGTNAIDDAITIGNTGVASAGQSVWLRVGAGSNTVNVNGGTTNLYTQVAADGAGFIVANINNSAIVNLPRTQYLAELHINNTAQVKLLPNAYKMLLLNTLTLSATAKLDLADNDMIVYSGNASAITALITSGYANGTWTGYGITTSTSDDYTALGVILNQESVNQTLYDTWSGTPVALTDVIVRFSYVGDANLDGIIDSTDYFQIDSAYVSHLTGWYNGNFNYDQAVNADDYFLIDSGWVAQAGSAPVPSISTSTAIKTGDRCNLTAEALLSREEWQLFDEYGDPYEHWQPLETHDPISSWTIYWGDGDAMTVAGQTVATGPESDRQPGDIRLTKSTINLTHVYAEPGNYTVTVAAKGRTLNWWVANVAVEVTSGVAELPIRGASGANEGDVYAVYLQPDEAGSIARWEMDWGDENVETVWGDPPLVSHIYTKHSGADGYWVIAKGYDATGAVVGVGWLNVAIANVAPTVVLSGADTFGPVGAYYLNLSATDPGSDPLTWSIDWGDSSLPATGTGSVAAPWHLYTTGDSHTISVTTSDGQNSTTTTKTISKSTGQGIYSTLVTEGGTLEKQGGFTPVESVIRDDLAPNWPWPFLSKYVVVTDPVQAIKQYV